MRAIRAEDAASLLVERVKKLEWNCDLLEKEISRYEFPYEDANMSHGGGTRGHDTTLL